jgi:hypothetical protein
MFEYKFYGGGTPAKTTIWEHSEGSLGMQHSRGCEEHNRGSRWAQLGSWEKYQISEYYNF